MFRIKLFVWRLAHNSGLQVKLNIARRGLDLNTPCPIWSRFDEDTGHLCFKLVAGRAPSRANAGTNSKTQRRKLDIGCVGARVIARTCRHKFEEHGGSNLRNWNCNLDIAQHWIIQNNIGVVWSIII
jgi:hypothetical protein